MRFRPGSRTSRRAGRISGLPFTIDINVEIFLARKSLHLSTTGCARREGRKRRWLRCSALRNKTTAGSWISCGATIVSSIFARIVRQALPLVRIDVVAAIIREGNSILITQRLDNVHLARLWEFPGGKVEPGESLETALQREIHEELGIKIHVRDEFFAVDHDYPTKSVRLHFFNCTVAEGEARPLDVADLR